MNLSKQISNQLREVILNGSWVSTNLKTVLNDVSLVEAQQKIADLNTIFDLTYHISYYIKGLLQVLEGGPLDIKDKYSFDAPKFSSDKEWRHFLDEFYLAAERFTTLVQGLEDNRLGDDFVKPEYGNYYRNIICMVEHSYYHLGQIVIIKKLIRYNV